MATRQRKTATKRTETTEQAEDIGTSVPASPISVVRIIRVLLFAVFASFLASQFLTESWFWGYKSPYTNPAFWKHKISNLVNDYAFFGRLLMIEQIRTRLYVQGAKTIRWQGSRKANLHVFDVSVVFRSRTI